MFHVTSLRDPSSDKEPERLDFLGALSSDGCGGLLTSCLRLCAHPSDFGR